MACTDFLTFYLPLQAIACCYGYSTGVSVWLYLGLYPAGLVLIICNALIRLYQGDVFYPGAALGVVEEIRRLTFSVILMYLLMMGFFFVSKQSDSYSRAIMFLSCLSTLFLLPITRWSTRSFLKHRSLFQIPALILGAGRTGQCVAWELKKDRQSGLRPVGFLDDDPDKSGTNVGGLPVLGRLSDAAAVGKERNVNYLILCLPPEAVMRGVKEFSKSFKYILMIPSNEVLPSAWIYPYDFCGYMGLEVRNKLLLKGPRMLKHAMEIMLAILAIMTLWPLLFALALAVKLSSPGPVFYRAKRLGLGGKTIHVLKFRTMYEDADQRLEEMLANDPEKAAEWRKKFKLTDDPRITPLGRLLRRTSLDELPQFWNILTGEMAVIGPRPIVEREKVYYGDKYELISRVKPGISGLWQVSGRSDTTYEQRVRLDCYYIMNWSPWLDYFILLKTVKEVLLCRGAE